jgi:serine protease inhibitor
MNPSRSRFALALFVLFALPAAAGDSAKAVATGNNAFALDLYGKLSAKPGNVFYSPYSISAALGMTWAGARGATADEMAKTLHFGNHVHAGFAALNKRLIGQQPGYQLSVANRLFVKQSYPLLEAFTAVAKEQYLAPVEQVDFGMAETRKHINGWVEDQTSKRIKDLIGEGVLNSLTRLVLVNAIYFKGTWATEFEKKSTTPQPFFSGDKKFDVPMMFRSMKHEAHVRYGEVDGVQVLELPYKGGDVAMVVLLPRARDGLSAFEKKLDAKKFDQLVGALSPFEVEVFLPRFRVEQSLALAPTLQAMGMPQAFSEKLADFSGMSGKKDLYISAVIHKAFVEVNEEGTEAAAATAVVMATKSAAPMSETFRADHPFLFALRDRKSGSILFLGRLDDPR